MIKMYSDGLYVVYPINYVRRDGQFLIVNLRRNGKDLLFDLRSSFRAAIYMWLLGNTYYLNLSRFNWIPYDDPYSDHS